MSGEAEVIDRETGEIALTPDDVRLSWQPMNEEQARKVTVDIKTYAIRLCHLVRDAKTGQAWTPLGYETWGEYVETEFGMSRQRAQQLIDHANKLDLTAEVVELASPPGEAITERATRGLNADAIRDALIAAMAEAPAPATEADRLAIAEQAIASLRVEVRKAKQAASTAVDAVTAQQNEEAAFARGVAVAHQNTNTGAGGDDGSTPAGDADPNEGGDGASGHDAGQDDPEPPAAVSDEEPPPSSDEPQQVPAPAAAQDPGKAGAPESRAAATGSTGASSAGAGDGGGTGDVLPTPPAETLPADWRDLIGHATYLLRLDAAQVAAAATADDDADLCALTEWCFRYVQAKEQNA